MKSQGMLKVSRIINLNKTWENIDFYFEQWYNVITTIIISNKNYGYFYGYLFFVLPIFMVGQGNFVFCKKRGFNMCCLVLFIF